MSDRPSYASEDSHLVALTLRRVITRPAFPHFSLWRWASRHHRPHLFQHVSRRDVGASRTQKHPRYGFRGRGGRCSPSIGGAWFPPAPSTPQTLRHVRDRMLTRGTLVESAEAAGSVPGPPPFEACDAPLPRGELVIIPPPPSPPLPPFDVSRKLPRNGG